MGSLYKHVAKIIIRLGHVKEKHISPNQLTFQKGRMLINGVVVVNEVIDLTKRSQKTYIILNMDFEKAYNYVS